MSRISSQVRSFAARRRSWLLSAAAAGLVLVAAPGAHAQTTTVDYGALATSAKTEIVAAIVAGAPVVFGIMAIIVGVGLTMAWVRRSAHG